jgi:hypothetical protein
MKRTHRDLLVYNWIVTYQDEDGFSYMEWAQLKKYLSRRELIQLIRTVRSGGNQVIFSNPLISSVTGV